MDFKPFFSTKSSRAEVTTYCGLTHVNFTNMTSGISDGRKIFSAVGTFDASVSCFSQQGFPVRFRYEAWRGRDNQIRWVKTSYCKNQWIRGLLLSIFEHAWSANLLGHVGSKACLKFYKLLHQCSCSYFSFLVFFFEYVTKNLKSGSSLPKVAKMLEKVPKSRQNNVKNSPLSLGSCPTGNLDENLQCDFWVSVLAYKSFRIFDNGGQPQGGLHECGDLC